MANSTGTIFNIQRFSIHDGPGIRTTVFFKGCPLRCFWCHNPEGLRKTSEIQFEVARCVACGACVQACAEGAQQLNADGRTYDRARCKACGACVEACFAGGLQMVGQEISAEQVIGEVMLDKAFYANSGGGVTLSGGEPMLQPAFALEILAGCKERGIQTALETSTHYRWETLAQALPVTDLFMVDIKHLDPQKHQSATGVTNERILANIRRLAVTGKPIIFRTPVIPGVNDTVAEIEAIAEFARETAYTRLENGGHQPERITYELLAFHQLAADKYASLGLAYPAAHLTPPSKEWMAVLAEAAAERGIAVKSH